MGRVERRSSERTMQPQADVQRHGGALGGVEREQREGGSGELPTQARDEARRRGAWVAA